jgi:mannosyl-oligosaccharide glucosidase
MVKFMCISEIKTSGPENRAVVGGPHADDFKDRIGKTHFVGRPLKDGDMWQASRA